MFNEKLKELREKANMTQFELAEKYGVSPQTVSYWEKGREPSFSVLCSLSDLFNVSTDYLLDRSTFKNFEDEDNYNFLIKRMGFSEDYPFPGIQNIVLDYLNPLIKQLFIYFGNNTSNEEHRHELFEHCSSILENVTNFFQILNDLFLKEDHRNAFIHGYLCYTVKTKADKRTLHEKVKELAYKKTHLVTVDEMINQVNLLSKELKNINHSKEVLYGDVKNSLNVLSLSLNNFFNYFEDTLHENTDSATNLLEEITVILGGVINDKEERE